MTHLAQRNMVHGDLTSDNVLVSWKATVSTSLCSSFPPLPSIIHFVLVNKQGNVVTNGRYVAKIADFGLSKYLNEGEAASKALNILWASPVCIYPSIIHPTISINNNTIVFIGNPRGLQIHSCKRYLVFWNRIV